MELAVYLLALSFLHCFLLFLSHFLIYALYNEPFEVSGWVWETWDDQGLDLALEEFTQL